MLQEAIRDVLASARVIAVVGASPKRERTSNEIVRFLLRAGYTVYPVNPMYDTVEELRCYPSVQSIPEQVDIVDVVVGADKVMPVMDDAIAAKAKFVWMQTGIINEAAAAKGEAAGIPVLMDRCIMVEHRLNRVPPRA